MRYRNLFENCKAQIKEQVKAVWLEDKELWRGGVTLRDYERELDSFLDECFTGKNILVEDMGEWENAESFPTDLLPRTYWREWVNKENDSLSNANAHLRDKGYNPFRHQVTCWKHLLEDNKSICVTTGTGSGKTECFMVPLVKDLADNYATRHSNNFTTGPEPVQALFLYPLNALMDDQRTRMSECIECCGQDLKFAVYNGNTPEDENDDKRNADTAMADRRKHEYVLRSEIRQSSHPNILFTNPTMLEYMLLRARDQDILNHSQGQLRWIVIDETHTFTGAGAAELALLIRRVLDAFGTPIDNVRFATSSATVGGPDGAEKLKEFISKITGKQQNQIEIVPGERTLQNCKGHNYQNLHNSGFLTLEEAVPGDMSVIDKLDTIDTWCENGLKVKLHFFAKALNRGLYVNLNKGDDTSFYLLDKIPIDPETGSFDMHILEAKYCSHCGTVFAQATREGNRLTPKTSSTSSIFDDVDNSAIDSDNDEDDTDNPTDNTNADPQNPPTDFLITHSANNDATSTAWGYTSDNDALRFNVLDDMEINQDDAGRYVMYGDDGNGICPVCGEHSLRSFCISASKVARILAPYLLEQAQGSHQEILFDGKQMIAFADSRKKAAKPTLEQNKESERKWVEWVIYNKLREDQADTTRIHDLEEDLETEIVRQQNDPHPRHENRIRELERNLLEAKSQTLSWNDALLELQRSPYCDYFAKQFAGNDDLNEFGECKPEYKNRYVLAALYEVFKRRKKKSKSAETKGQLKVVYEGIESLRWEPEDVVLPASVVSLNEHIHDEEKKIHLNDWIDFLTIYLDNRVRSNECLFYKNNNPNWNTIDIDGCRNLRTVEGVRRTLKKDNTNNNVIASRYKELLSQLLGNEYASLNSDEKELVNDVINSCWRFLYDRGLIERGQTYDNQNGWHDDSLDENYGEDEQGRMNLSKIQFTIPDENSLRMCPVTNRVLSTTFKGLTPFKDGRNGYGILATPLQGRVEQMEEPKLFIQSEHTAQLGRTLVKERIKDFKNKKINILSCSTTMEMGVDLGSVELVEMTNVPPHPANYKQRAGRAGRRGQTRSVCLTICGSDGVDSRFFAASKENVTKTINPPTVDLNSPQVLQRHINSYLFKQWLGQLPLLSEVIDLFSSYHWGTKPNGEIDRQTAYSDGDAVLPNGGVYLGANRIPYDDSHTYYAGWYTFVQWLHNLVLNGKDSAIRLGIEKLIEGSVFSKDNIPEYVNNTANAMTHLWEEINQFFLMLKQNQASIESYVADNNKSDEWLEKRKKGINYSFTSRLSEPLLNYLSTHQFLPNANMPINIVELKVTNNDNRTNRNNENPTYDLVTALGQWAPGNYHTIKDTTYQIGGVQWNRNQSLISVAQCSDCGHTWITQERQCPNCGSANLKGWPVNGQTNLRLLVPAAFVPTTDRSRITDNSQNHTMANAELIGATESVQPARGWFAHRVSGADSVTASHILIYNHGIGYGYRICKHCGKAELETGIADNTDLSIINSFYGKTIRNRRTLRYHNDVLGEDTPCFFDTENDSPDDKLFRNLLIGGLIQTDYCEISLFREVGLTLTPFQSDEDKKILTTLGILICSFMVDEGICERDDIDFLLMGSRALCIYDKAKGGAGYSRQLDQEKIENALNYSKVKLTQCDSLFQLLDSHTQRYADQIDTKSTLEWLQLEAQHRKDVPRKIAETYPGTQLSSFIEISERIRRSENE